MDAQTHNPNTYYVIVRCKILKKKKCKNLKGKKLSNLRVEIKIEF